MGGFDTNLTLEMRLSGVAPTMAATQDQPGKTNLRAAVYVLDSSAGSRNGRTFESRPCADLQLKFLRSMVARRKLDLLRIYRDRLTGEKQARSSLESMMRDAEQGRFQVALFFSFAGLADSLRQLILRLHRIHSAGVRIVVAQEGLDSTRPSDSEALRLITLLSKFESSVKAGRIREGLNKARLNGTKTGVSPGRPRVVVDIKRVACSPDSEEQAYGRLRRNSNLVPERCIGYSVLALPIGSRMIICLDRFQTCGQ